MKNSCKNMLQNAFATGYHTKKLKLYTVISFLNEIYIRNNFLHKLT